MPRSPHAVPLALSVLCFALPGRAAVAAPSPAPADTAVYTLPFETVVDASRQDIPLRLNPAATTVLAREAIGRSSRGLTVADALASVPGLRIEAPADAERVHLSIRGQGILAESGIRGIKVLLDGLPINDPTGVAPDLYDVDWATVDRVEVLRGPSGALYGGGGSGGVLNLTTADGGAVPVGGRLLLAGGSYGYRKTLAETGGSAGAANYRLSLSQAAGDGYRDHNAFWCDNLYGKLRWTPAPNVELQQVLAWTDYNEENAEGLNAAQVQQDRRAANPDAAPFDERFKTDRFTAGITGRVGLPHEQSLRFATYLRATDYMEPRPRELVRRRSLAPGLTAQYDVAARAGGVRHHLSLGAESAWQGTDALRFYNPGRANQDSLLANGDFQQRGQAIYVLDRVELARDWSVTAGGRYDYLFDKLVDHPFKGNPDLTGHRSFQRVTGRVGAAWSPGPALSVYGNWGQGFQPPSNEELANNPVAFGGFNQSLDPATSQGPELGARGVVAGRASWSVDGFLLDTKNDFDRYRLSARPGLTFYRNSGTSRRWGAEAHAAWKPLARVTLDAAYTWSRFRYTWPAAIDGHTLPNSPEHQFVLGTEVALAREVTLGLGTQMQGDWQLDPQNSAAVPGYALWNADLAWHWRAGSLAGTAVIGGRNVLGAAYFAYTEPDPDGNSYQPGPEQEFFARVSLSR